MLPCPFDILEESEVSCEQLEWIRQWDQLAQGIIPTGRTTCQVETLQQYREFTAEEIQHVLRQLGKLAQMMYDVRYRLFPDGKPRLAWVEALEWVVWMVATFSQPSNGSNFVDLSTRLGQIINHQ
jgi:hypothetical protein